jgi:hypothetical protein
VRHFLNFVSSFDLWLYRAEAAIALRQRLNETVDQLDALKAQHTELEVKFEAQGKELTIAKSDRESPLHNSHTFFPWDPIDVALLRQSTLLIRINWRS